MKICTITGSRAEFYILKNLMLKLQSDKKFRQHVIVTGSHNSKLFGKTINEIRKQKIKIDSVIDISVGSDKEIDIAKSFSMGVRSFSKKFLQIKPDLLLVLGDRYEIYSAAIAACLNRIPIAHIYGGESTQGAIDEAIRHSITKLSHIHFASTKEHYNRVKQLGENEKYTFKIGSLGVEAIKKIKFFKKKEIEKKLNLKFSKRNILVTFHPETLKSKNVVKKNFDKLLKCLKKLNDTTIIFTMPGADANFKVILKKIYQFVKGREKSYFFKYLGHEKYFSICNSVDLMIGNSSSGIIEMPSFKKATINLGERQDGRVKAKTVLNVDFNEKNILKKIKYSYSKSFRKILKSAINPYDNGNSSDKIIKILKKINLNNILKKKFFDYKLQ